MHPSPQPGRRTVRRALLAASVVLTLPLLAACSGSNGIPDRAPAAGRPSASVVEPTSASVAAVGGATSAPASSTPSAGPRTAAAERAADPSGQPVPRGNLPHWRQILVQDFTRPAALGSFAEVYPGWAGYDRNRDSSRGHRPLATQGLWNSLTTSSVKNGLFHCDLHTRGTTPQVCAITPTTTGRWWEGRRYGRYSVRFKADATADYKIAYLLWPTSDIWAQGEVDFPEGYLDSAITAGAHRLGDDPAPTPFFRDTGVRMQSWHTATTEWSPGRLTFLLDGKRIGTTTDPAVVPTHPMRWALQAESRLTAEAPARDLHAHIAIDWVAQWAWRG